ncbi:MULTISPECIES: GlsB/YeaQ/YmgE family stress response membrane protein [unclassified Schlesneria]|uniref:GlsB/YeaQ/YmgE family stress response membrane protein n=1 Tax=Schlesneria TaxID=656899 RepID=UPI002F0D2F33
MWDFISWMVIGLVAGLLARALVPGEQPMGLFFTMILGMVGSIVGGFISSAVFNYRVGDPEVHAGGLFIATGGAMLMLIIYLSMTRGNRGITPRP